MACLSNLRSGAARPFLFAECNLSVTEFILDYLLPRSLCERELLTQSQDSRKPS